MTKPAVIYVFMILISLTRIWDKQKHLVHAWNNGKPKRFWEKNVTRQQFYDWAKFCMDPPLSVLLHDVPKYYTQLWWELSFMPIINWHVEAQLYGAVKHQRWQWYVGSRPFDTRLWLGYSFGGINIYFRLGMSHFLN